MYPMEGKDAFAVKKISKFRSAIETLFFIHCKNIWNDTFMKILWAARYQQLRIKWQ